MAQAAGAVLAAGAGTRMGGPKALLRVDGARLVDRAVAVLAAGGCDPVLAVVRPGVGVEGATVLVNPAPEEGMRSSLELAVTAAEVTDAGLLAVVLVDTPGVTAAAVRRVLATWRPGRVAMASYAGRRGQPVAMAPALWRAALAVAGPDEGARAFLATHPELVDEAPADGDPADLDTPADLHRWLGG